MKPAFTFDEIRIIEKNIIEKDNIPSIILMENAGKNSCNVLLESFPDVSDYEIIIICGKGNNAGDGYTMARHLIIKGFFVTVVQLINPEELKGDAQINFSLLKVMLETGSSGEFIYSYDLKFFDNRNLSGNKIIFVDAVLGTGIKGKLDEKFTNAINAINALRTKNKKSKIVSLDVPSGLMSGEQVNQVVNADMTISMGTYKTELLFGEGKENSGKLNIVPIGITENLISRYNSYNKNIVELDDVKKIFPKRKKTSYKYSNGKVLIIGGSKGLSGAVAMSSLSALKCGAGGVVAAMPVSVSRIFNKKLFEIMTLELDETPGGTIASGQLDKLNKRLDWADSVLIGPGISTNENTAEFVSEVIANCKKNLVIDADALTLLANNKELLINRKYNNEIILTPHPGEFSRFAGVSIAEILNNRFEILKEFASKYGVSIALKSETTISCIHGGEMFINTSGNQSLATIGSGDVLSGIIVSLLAQTKDSYSALICGNYLHGLCSDIFFRKYGNKQTASPQDMIKLIPNAVSELIK